MADPSSPTLEVDDNADLFAGMKKKKKSKKVNFDEEAEAAPSPTPAPVIEEETSAPPAEDTGDLDFSDLKKKKKKKTVRIASDDEEESTPKPFKKTDALGNELEDDPATLPTESEKPFLEGEEEADEFADLKKMKKKKGSKKSTFDLEAFEKELADANGEEEAVGDSAKATPVGSDGEEGEGDDEEVEGENPFAKEGDDGVLTKAEAANEAKAWLKEDRDYHYSELLGRFYSLLYATHPSLSSSGVKKKYTIPPPQMHREGNKRSIFANVVEICKKMHRQPEHVIQFLFAELGTSGSVDGKGMLVIKGRFQQKQMENVLRRYIVEYVTCKTCKSPDTLLTKDNRLFFMTCESCGSSRSVSAIKSGFQAQTGKRRAQRAAA